MQLWAAIDMLEGSVVTLVQGRISERTVWKEDPLRLAERWQDEGADGLHLIDLDAAIRGSSTNRQTMLRIISKAKVPVQVGGGIRRKTEVGEWLGAGAARVVVGTLAYSEPSTLSELLSRHGAERVVVAADYRNGMILGKGWTESQGVTVSEAVVDLENRGVRNILTTSVGRDGTGTGPDLDTIARICRSTSMNVVASGGISAARDLIEIERAGAQGAILGRALYEGSIKMSELGRVKK